MFVRLFIQKIQGIIIVKQKWQDVGTENILCYQYLKNTQFIA
jgi:hypothetical protein